LIAFICAFLYCCSRGPRGRCTAGAPSNWISSERRRNAAHQPRWSARYNRRARPPVTARQPKALRQAAHTREEATAPVALLRKSRKTARRGAVPDPFGARAVHLCTFGGRNAIVSVPVLGFHNVLLLTPKAARGVSALSQNDIFHFQGISSRTVRLPTADHAVPQWVRDIV
jgi:hypothetical protein